MLVIIDTFQLIYVGAQRVGKNLGKNAVIDDSVVFAEAFIDRVLLTGLVLRKISSHRLFFYSKGVGATFTLIFSPVGNKARRQIPVCEHVEIRYEDFGRPGSYQPEEKPYSAIRLGSEIGELEIVTGVLMITQCIVTEILVALIDA